MPQEIAENIIIEREGVCNYCGVKFITDENGSDVAVPSHPEKTSHPYWHTVDHLRCTECGKMVWMNCHNCSLCKDGSGCYDRSSDFSWVQCEFCKWEQ